MVTSNAQMEAMRMLILAKKSAIRNDQKAFLSSFVMRTVAYACLRPALLKRNLCVKMAKTWQTVFVMESVTLNSQELWIHFVGPVPMAPKGVSSRYLVVMGSQIVTMLLN